MDLICLKRGDLGSRVETPKFKPRFPPGMEKKPPLWGKTPGAKAVGVGSLFG